ncbi:cytochrome c [Paraglaciecola sp. MB-3u-78]|jgi:cytochrome c553|uniref:c-type cytochrome n=1 Tax=Paraglaciecola sp. MB-3u-78 TaxID=2058332 RepID=UPI000C3407A7|nr:cytochrome c [Paraglaciecola sp. MB-3u-78]PKG99861.1 cytochrome C-555 [Paraglaciecola sp. MB-3u-78]
MKKIHINILSIVFAAAGLVSQPILAADIAAGKSKSVTCGACHGNNGISMIPMYPNLAGQKEQYLVIQLKAFRDGDRKNMVMTPMATGLSDTDIDNLSAYFSSLDPAGK